jgi:plastocyanin
MRLSTPARCALVAVTLVAVVAACGGGDDGASEGPADPVTKLTITSTKTEFDIERFKVPVGEEITVTYANEDDGVSHNWDLKGVEGGKTDLERGPATKKATFTVDEPGEYEYVCDVHPVQMKGTIEAVQA